jgi:hypothetical protein
LSKEINEGDSAKIPFRSRSKADIWLSAHRASAQIEQGASVSP